MHPTVKPVALVADAIRDCSKRGETVLIPLADLEQPSLRPKRLAAEHASSSSTLSIAIRSSSASRSSRQQGRLVITGENFGDIAEERRADTLQTKKEQVQ